MKSIIFCYWLIPQVSHSLQPLIRPVRKSTYLNSTADIVYNTQCPSNLTRYIGSPSLNADQLLETLRVVNLFSTGLYFYHLVAKKKMNFLSPIIVLSKIHPFPFRTENRRWRFAPLNCVMRYSVWPSSTVAIHLCKVCKCLQIS